FYSNFEYTKKYISSADFAIGVFEGPLGGTEHNYSSSNYRDGKKLYLNFPDEWADAVKDAGFDLVTLANNHILDMGEQGKDRTIDILRNKNMEFIGAYKDAKEKNENRVKVMEVDGIRFAFLSYTEFINGYSKSDLVNGTVSNTTNIILSPSDPEYEKILTDVRNDFKRARELKVDFIIVIPHWGTQFEDEPDDFQLIWQKTFVELGADIILGDHTHSVQPVSIGKNNVFTLYCPGNYANIYREFNGDCNALVEVYIDRSEKKVIGGAIIPMWTTSSLVGNYRPIPIYTILTDKEAGKAITTFDLDRVNDVLKHITNTMLGREIDISLPQERYYFDVDGFMRTKAESIEINDKMKSGVVWSLLSSSKRICFVGDSITRGSKNGGIPWYEPLESSLTGEIINCSWGGATTKDLLNEHLNEIIEAKADLYVIAIGTNDVRYRSEKCALNSTEYVNNLQKIRNAIISLKPDTKFIFIAPWTSTDGDRISKLSYKDKIAMNNEYSSALKKWAESNGDVYVNANEYIDKYLNLYPQSKYIVDFIHPNYLRGIGLYSTSFLSVTSSNKE
ncbi:MAG: CapA family protein, partial [Candidatus Riflebacteria bacterium]|nr:CapA family protein [Candidatus Riflebacteria bacterium]